MQLFTQVLEYLACESAWMRFVVSSGGVSRLPNSLGMTSMNDSLTSLMRSCAVSSAATAGRLPSAARGSPIS